MAKTLTLDVTSFKFSDNETDLSFTALQKGMIVSDSTLSATIKIKQVDVGYLKSVSAKWVNKHIVISSGDLSDLPVGSYLVELWLSSSSGYEIYPDSGFVNLYINQNATGISGNLISSITLGEFQQQFSDLGKDLMNKILDIKVGPQGEKGEKGDNGTQGVQGIQGERGEQGEQGIQGDKGDTGAAGIKGDKGDKGDTGPQGVQGDVGPQGPKGDTGPQGDTGAVGAKGDQGIHGVKGDTGDRGITGATGPQGPKGDTGAKGDTGVVDTTADYTWKGTNTFTGVTDIQIQKQYKASFTIGANTINLIRIGSIVYVNSKIKEKINGVNSYGTIPTGFTPANSSVVNFILFMTQGSCLFQASEKNIWFPVDLNVDAYMSGIYITNDALPTSPAPEDYI